MKQQLKVRDSIGEITVTFKEMQKYHGKDFLGGVALSFKVLELAFRELLDDNPEHGYHIIKNISEVIGERLIGKCIQFLRVILDSDDFPIEKLYTPKCKK